MWCEPGGGNPATQWKPEEDYRGAAPRPCGLAVCRHNTIIIYVNYNYCANSLVSRSCYEGGFSSLLPSK